jgi:hypothetical protein
MRNHFGTSVLDGLDVYGFDETFLTAVSVLNGAPHWQTRGYGKGTLVLADGHLLVLSDRGALGLVEAASEELREKAKAQVLSGRCWTAPSLGDGVLYLRNLKEMVAVEVGRP